MKENNEILTKGNKQMSEKKKSLRNSKRSKKVESSKQQKKRRGRRPNKIIQDNHPQYEDQSVEDGCPILLKLELAPPTTSKARKNNIISYCDVSSSSEDIFNDDIPKDKKCTNCEKNKKLITNLQKKIETYEKKDHQENNKIYKTNINLIDISTNGKRSLKKTTILCWWDCHAFDGIPVFLPEFIHQDTYHVMGCFCSFNCALAYNLYYLRDLKINQRTSLLYKMYRELFNYNYDHPVEIKVSPPKEILDSFGGTMSINKFRKNLNISQKEYVVYVPPIKPIGLYVEEKNNEKQNNPGNDYPNRRPRAKTRRLLTK